MRSTVSPLAIIHFCGGRGHTVEFPKARIAKHGMKESAAVGIFNFGDPFIELLFHFTSVSWADREKVGEIHFGFVDKVYSLDGELDAIRVPWEPPRASWSNVVTDGERILGLGASYN